jgi:transposase-like protein
MSDNNVLALKQPENINDPLTQLIKDGAKKLIAQALEAELQELLDRFGDQKVDGTQRVVRNGFLPEREIHTGVGPVEVKVPKVRDRERQGVKFNSTLIPGSVGLLLKAHKNPIEHILYSANA